MQATQCFGAQGCATVARIPSKNTSISSNVALRGTPVVATRSAVYQVVARPTVVAEAAAAADAQTEQEGVAHLRYQRGSPLKVRRVLDQIRGRSYEEALMMLEYMPYRSCEPILKTLLSAAANAKNNSGLKKTKLVVTECYANEGPVMKRAQPRAKGRAYKILKPTCHITVKVAERE